MDVKGVARSPRYRSPDDDAKPLHAGHHGLNRSGNSHWNGVAIESWSTFTQDCYGALILEGGRFRIAVSTACPTTGRRRFTIGHELAHYHIEGHMDALLSSNNGVHLSFGSNFRKRKDPDEVEADAFASELLYPGASPSP